MLLPTKGARGVGGVAAREAETTLSRGAQLRAKFGSNFSEYMRFRNQGFNPLQAKDLMQPYTGAGHHFPITQALGRELELGEAIMENPLNKLSGKGMSKGRFYELHYCIFRKNWWSLEGR
jgi:hypothetical protein